MFWSAGPWLPTDWFNLVSKVNWSGRICTFRSWSFVSFTREVMGPLFIIPSTAVSFSCCFVLWHFEPLLCFWWKICIYIFTQCWVGLMCGFAHLFYLFSEEQDIKKNPTVRLYPSVTDWVIKRDLSVAGRWMGVEELKNMRVWWCRPNFWKLIITFVKIVKINFIQ